MSFRMISGEMRVAGLRVDRVLIAGCDDSLAFEDFLEALVAAFEPSSVDLDQLPIVDMLRPWRDFSEHVDQGGELYRQLIVEFLKLLL